MKFSVLFAWLLTFNSFNRKPDWAAFVSFPTAAAAHRAMRVLNNSVSSNAVNTTTSVRLSVSDDENIDKDVESENISSNVQNHNEYFEYLDPRWATPFRALMQAAPGISVKPAPDFREIIWENVSVKFFHYYYFRILHINL